MYFFFKREREMNLRFFKIIDFLKNYYNYIKYKVMF